MTRAKSLISTQKLKTLIATVTHAKAKPTIIARASLLVRRIKETKQPPSRVRPTLLPMLPRLPGVKSCMFTKRIVAFNETFAALGAAGKNTTVVWHEAIAARLAQDICSTYWKFFVVKQRGTEHIVFWADNCSAQNKNWEFFTFLASAVNSNLIAAMTIRMNYLVTGHTFM